MHLLNSPCCWSLGRCLLPTCEAQTFICWQCPPQVARAGVPVAIRAAAISAKTAILIISVSFLPLRRGGEPPAPPDMGSYRWLMVKRGHRPASVPDLSGDQAAILAFTR